VVKEVANMLCYGVDQKFNRDGNMLNAEELVEMMIDQAWLC